MEKFCKGTRGGWEKYEHGPLLGGQYGTCFDISMLTEGEDLQMYFSWRDCHSIARVTSRDGIHWSEPVICLEPRETPEGWENAVNRPYVLYREGQYHMWYTGQLIRDEGRGEGCSHIFYAVSDDGIRFRRVSTEPVLSPQAPWEKNSVMCPTVLWDENARLYKMWYSGGEQYEPDYIGYATSPDGIHWTKWEANPVFGPDPELHWEQAKVGGCQMIYEDGWYWMFYIGYQNVDYAQVGMARSRDGITNWERSASNPIVAPSEDGWDAEACYKPFVVKSEDSWWLWYNGRRGKHEQIGLCIQPGKELRF